MMQPKRTKYRKQFRGSIRSSAQSGFRVAFGDYGIKSLGEGWFTAAQIEATRRTIANFTKRGGKIWIRVFPDKPITKKAPGSTMGAGKGDVDTYVAVIKKGKILFELGGIENELALQALNRASHKIPFPTKIVKKD
jgi:large subunit ribosomal protein L16